jgi:hypothetical protein
VNGVEIQYTLTPLAASPGGIRRSKPKRIQRGTASNLEINGTSSQLSHFPAHETPGRGMSGEDEANESTSALIFAIVVGSLTTEQEEVRPT